VPRSGAGALAGSGLDHRWPRFSANLAAESEPPPLPYVGSDALTTQAIANVIKARATAAGFNPESFGGHSLKRGAITTGMENHVHPADLKRMGRHKSFDVLGEYLEFGDLFERHLSRNAL
jgi:hypothetical protein